MVKRHSGLAFQLAEVLGKTSGLSGLRGWALSARNIENRADLDGGSLKFTMVCTIVTRFFVGQGA